MNMDEQENDSLMDQQENKNSGGKKRSLNPATNAAEKLKAAEKTTKQGAKVTAKLAEKQAGKKTGEVAAKLSVKLGKVSTQAGKAAQVAAKLSKIIATVGWILLLLIAIIGLLAFIITGLGLIMSGLKEIVSGFLNAVNGFLNGKENIVEESSIVDTLSYLKEMDYDLYGYGFSGLPNPLTEESDDEGNVTKKLTYSDSLWGNPEFEKAYRNILAYLVSDNYTYILQHENRTLLDIVTFAPGNGLIGIYFDNGLGIRGNGYSDFWNKGSITIEGDSAKNRKLKINARAFNAGPDMTYPLDGWTGRYGMPLEFLLSVHVATMAPDLSYKMATWFDPEVEVLLYEVEGGKIDSAVGPGGDESKKVGYDNLNVSLDAEGVKEIFIQYRDTIRSYLGDDANYSEYKCIGPPVLETIDNIKNFSKNKFIEEFEAKVKENIKIGEDRRRRYYNYKRRF